MDSRRPRGARVLHREAKGPTRAHAVRPHRPLPPPQRHDSRARRTAGRQRLPAEPAGGLRARTAQHQLGALRAQRPNPSAPSPSRARPRARARPLSPPTSSSSCAPRARTFSTPCSPCTASPTTFPPRRSTRRLYMCHAHANGNAGRDECALRMPPRGPSGLFTRRPRVPIDVGSAYLDPRADPYAEGSTTAIDSASTTASPCRSLEREAEREMATEGEVQRRDREAEAEIEVPMALAKPVRARRISTKL
ncbi:hypothetical protein B0H17DRAFT_13427 [Mycena rosella]|uniref:Uncharacterized protein n=1 Tax=Mycena rosella TaxID=1033263 RepID=A0AAD7GT03_MYCRO|nr:hypothetical protein B0H17DRAFT_13427 [Mycena rosella]